MKIIKILSKLIKLIYILIISIKYIEIFKKFIYINFYIYNIIEINLC